MGQSTGPIRLTTTLLDATAHVLATFGQAERRLIGQRTKEALAAKKAAGIKLGRPPDAVAD